jgi:bis(5'-nucleosyl)-tetraphosphatase (symmetrical)
MAYYAVGDIQGCYDPLRRVLDQAGFDPSKDTLFCVGDLVNRGPKSLKVLRFIKSLNNQCVSVLGNHDIHLLSMLYGVREHRQTDTLSNILEAPDAHELANWLRSKPLLHTDTDRKFIVCHAGIYPWWSLKKASRRAAKVEKIFRDEGKCIALLKKIYSNYPSQWKSGLNITQKHRFTINAFTRMRFVSDKGHLNFSESGYNGSIRKNRLPWFSVANPSLAGYRTIFGHWSALGLLNTPEFLALDTGCVWGKHLTLAKIPKNPNKQAKLFIAPNNR